MDTTTLLIIIVLVLLFGGGWSIRSVAIFFISALTISITYEAHIAKFGKSFRAQFSWLLKRFFRIAPLYYIAACFYTFERAIALSEWKCVSMY